MPSQWSPSWPEDYQEIFRRISENNSHLLSSIEMLHSIELTKPKSIEQLKRAGFTYTFYDGWVLIERCHAHGRVRQEPRTPPHMGTAYYHCIVCNTTGRTLWRVPRSSHSDADQIFDVVTVIYYQLPE